MQPPAQEIVARDLHDQTWTFRHIFRGITPVKEFCLSSYFELCWSQVNHIFFVHKM